jgi:diguanylate cyclase (GGDEF)-like protein
MPPDDKENPQCPIGEPACPRLGELTAYRAEAAELLQKVHTDSLTGLYNYRHFQLMLERELERTRRTDQPTALVMVDLDHFKQINDRWGHEVGNRILRHCAGLLVGGLRKIDVACRYGGEEFALILPGTPLPRAVNAADRLRLALVGTALQTADGALTVTASMGVDVYAKDEEGGAAEFVQRTDAQLYQAKEQGRNRVCHRPFDLTRPRGQVGREEKEALTKP